MKKQIDKCPHCGSNWGVYVKMDLINVPRNINFDGSQGYNGEMYDNAEKIKEKSNVYCQECGKVICRWETFCKINGIVTF
ncbi:MAG: hypothetical protein IJF49_08365 [Clostridia bacterium]|nr:hypothetical protein [Clostridia bacterium]